MEVSAIMNIYELAANKRVKTRENLPEKKNGDHIKANTVGKTKFAAGDHSLVLEGTKKRLQEADIQKEVNTSKPDQGKWIDLHT